MLGLKRHTVKLVSHNPKWETSFEIEKKRIKKVFGNFALDIQHVGSTAVPGIHAKPVLDIAIVVPSLAKVKKYTKALKRIGYSKKIDDRLDRLFFAKGPDIKRTHYIHIGKIGSRYINDMILFRDYLRKHKKTARKYDNVKQKLANEYSDNREVYTAKKEKFIKSILNKN